MAAPIPASAHWRVATIMHWGFGHMQADDGGSVYLRLSTRPIEQPARDMAGLRDDVIAGGYWAVEPGAHAPLAIVYSGAVAPEAQAAHGEILEDIPGAGLLAVTSADRLHRGWREALAVTTPTPKQMVKYFCRLVS